MYVSIMPSNVADEQHHVLEYTTNMAMAQVKGEKQKRVMPTFVLLCCTLVHTHKLQFTNFVCDTCMVCTIWGNFYLVGNQVLTKY